MGAHPDVEAHYRPRRIPLPDALRPGGFTTHDVKLIVNCHLHFDHCGGNPALRGGPGGAQSSSPGEPSRRASP
jgi:N-acyl homoserine lactone hydrolase